MSLRIIFLSAILLHATSMTFGQIPVEVFAGHQKMTLDVMFFRNFKNVSGEKTRWLFFNRNRASVDYRMTQSTFLPQFGCTEAVSYNHKNLWGFAPVGVVQVFGNGIFPKAGIQYVLMGGPFTLFTWLVSETRKSPDFDYFLLFRCIPKINDRMKLFLQVESVNTLPSSSFKNFNFTQRLRFGLQKGSAQYGLGVDFNQSGRAYFKQSNNAGLFVRYEF